MVWILIGAAVAVLAVALDVVGLPSATLFAALLVGVLVSIRKPKEGAKPVKLPGLANRLAQACVGVLIGALVQPSAVKSLASDWLIVLASVLATLVLSVVAGLLLGLHRDLDPVTGSFALIAGGASGLTAISKDLGADQRVVAVVQYLRVLVIVIAMPVVAAALPAGSGHTGEVNTARAPLWGDLLFTVGCVLAGVLLSRYPKIPAGSLLGPMLLAAVLAATGVAHGASVPGALAQVAYAVIGLQIGLSFTRESLRSVSRILPLALTLVVAMIAATAAIGVPLLRLAGASALDGYLATTPGGLYAVLATATTTGADTTLILTVQVLRLLVMLLLAPLISQLLGRRRQRTVPG